MRRGRRSRIDYPVPPASEITPKNLAVSRRKVLTTGATLFGGAMAAPLLRATADDWKARIQAAEKTDFKVDDDPTPRQRATSYNNFFEFGTRKEQPYMRAHRMETDPWSVTIAGEVERPGEYALEDILAPHDFEQRIYRHRCVEAWSKVIPWIGFPLGDLIERFEPTSRAKYVAFETLVDEDVMPGVARGILDWPYREALTIEEAVHPLTLLAVGMYDDVMPPQCGAPLRLVVPWKYGYKGIKSIVRIEFTEERPECLWELEQPEEYGWYGNVNPNVDHPRWDQSRERRIGELGRRETELYNGYAELVADLYPEGPDAYW